MTLRSTWDTKHSTVSPHHQCLPHHPDLDGHDCHTSTHFLKIQQSCNLYTFTYLTYSSTYFLFVIKLEKICLDTSVSNLVITLV